MGNSRRNTCWSGSVGGWHRSLRRDQWRLRRWRWKWKSWWLFRHSRAFSLSVRFGYSEDRNKNSPTFACFVLVSFFLYIYFVLCLNFTDEMWDSDLSFVLFTFTQFTVNLIFSFSFLFFFDSSDLLDFLKVG